MKITEKVDTACRAYLAGDNKTEAYEKGYETSKMKISTVRKRASEMFKDPDVIAYLDSLRGEVKSEFAVSAEQKKRWLVTVIEAGLQHVVKPTDQKDINGEAIEIDLGLSDSKAVISAVAELNRMDGDLATQKLSVTTMTHEEALEALK